MFEKLTYWHSHLEPKWLQALISLMAIVLLLTFCGIAIFALVQGFPYTLKYLTRFFSEVEIGKWAITIVFTLAGLTLLWVLIRKE